MSLRILCCFWWAVGWPSALLTVLHGGACCCTLHPKRECIFIAGCECGIAKYIPLVTLEETCFHFCHERGGQVIHGLNYIPVYVSLPYMSSWHGEHEISPYLWSLLIILLQKLIVTCQFLFSCSLIVQQKRGCREIIFSLGSAYGNSPPFTKFRCSEVD